MTVADFNFFFTPLMNSACITRIINRLINVKNKCNYKSFKVIRFTITCRLISI